MNFLPQGIREVQSLFSINFHIGITSGLIYKWRERYRVDETTDELKPSTERETEAKIHRLKRELAIAREERDILKKAIQVFSKDRTL